MKKIIQTLTDGKVTLRNRSGARVCLGTLSSVVLLLTGACAPSESEVEDPVAVEVGERVVLLSELQAQLDYWQDKGGALPRDRAAFLERYVERLVALEKARELGLDQDMELQRQWENLLIGRLRQTELDAQLETVTVTDEELESYYQRTIETYTRPAQVRLALLFLKVTDQMSPEDRDATRLRLEEAHGQAEELPANTAGFGALAMKYSEEATSRFKGGDIGWIQAGKERYRWPEAVVQAGFALAEKGATTQVIECDDGFYLLKKLDEREAVVRTLDGQLSASLRNLLLKEKRAAVAAQLKHSWEAEVEMTLHEDVLAKLDFSPDSENNEASAVFAGTP